MIRLKELVHDKKEYEYIKAIYLDCVQIGAAYVRPGRKLYVSLLAPITLCLVQEVVNAVQKDYPAASIEGNT